MTQAQYDGDVSRSTILDLLSDAENAKVSTAEGMPGLAEGEEYVDLENLDQGVQRAGSETKSIVGHLLPRSAVGKDTWSKILAQLGD